MRTLENRSPDLAETGADPARFPVRMALHHVIPDSTLRDFFNAVLACGHLEHFRPVLQSFIAHAPNYQGLDMGSSGRVAEFAVIAAEQMYEGHWAHAYLHGGRKPDAPPGSVSFARLYCNLPGNLFAGPRAERRPFRRAMDDDPGDGFERAATPAVGAEAHGRLSQIYDYMRRYIANTAHLLPAAEKLEGPPPYNRNPAAIEDVKSASRLLAWVACETKYHALDPDCWERTNLRNPEDRRDQRENRYLLRVRGG